jgi:hypothetical protein
VWGRVPRLSPDEQNRVVVGEIFGRLNSTAALRSHREAIRSVRPDVLLRETSEYGSALAAEAERVPQARFGIGLHAGEEMGLRHVAAVLDEIRAAEGIALDPGAARMRRVPYLTWFPYSLEDPEDPGPTGAVRLRDPAWEDAPAPLPDWWPGADPGWPVVYVTFGSVAGSFEGSGPIYAGALEAVAGLPVRVLLTTGRGLGPATLGPAAPNVRVEQWVRQAAVLGHAAAVVCHGGAGSTLGALAAGRPLVVVPLFADQPVNARRVEATGAGLSVSRDPAAIRAALERVLAEPSFADAAGRLAGEMRRHYAASDAAGVLGSCGICPHCGGAATQTARYPRALCWACSARTTDLAGRPVSFGNESMSGGFLARHLDDDSSCEQVTRDGRVLIDGAEYRAGEAHMGGTVVNPR